MPVSSTIANIQKNISLITSIPFHEIRLFSNDGATEIGIGHGFVPLKILLGIGADSARVVPCVVLLLRSRPHDSDVILFGRKKGQRYIDVVHDKNYCLGLESLAKSAKESKQCGWELLR